MLLNIGALLLFGFAIQPNLSGKFCSQRYVNGQWITKGDCGGPGRMSALQTELQRRAAEERKQQRTADKKWTVFQRRKYGNVSFFRGWDDYANGFGDRKGDFWLGLEAMHQLTKTGNVEMKIKMIGRNGIYWVVKYSSFRIGPGSDNYRLHVSGYSGNTTWGDYLARHNNQQFSTKDADHDCSSEVNCASYREGGWWYNNCAGTVNLDGGFYWSGDCGTVNLNGNFNKTSRKGFWWDSRGCAWDQDSTFLRFSEMKMRK